MSDVSEAEAQRSTVVAVRCPRDLLDRIDAAAAAEGLSRADIVRRATLQDLRAREALAGEYAHG